MPARLGHAWSTAPPSPVPDKAGRLNNCRILSVTAKGAHVFEIGAPGAEVMPELEPDPSDIEMPRLHGLTPFTGTSLDRVLRNIGRRPPSWPPRNSVNIGVLGLVLSAVDLGYQVVVPRDAVAAVPAEPTATCRDGQHHLAAWPRW